MQEKQFTFADFLDEISLAENSLIAFEQYTEGHIEMAKLAEDDIDRKTAQDKIDLAILYTKHTLLRLNALSKAFVGWELEPLLKYFHLKVESYTDPLLKGKPRSRVIEYFHGLPVNKKAKQDLQNNDLLAGCLDNPEIKGVVDDFDNVDGNSDKKPYLFNKVYFDRNCFLDLIDLRCSMAGALQRMIVLRDCETSKTLMVEVFKHTYIMPALANH